MAIVRLAVGEILPGYIGLLFIRSVFVLLALLVCWSVGLLVCWSVGDVGEGDVGEGDVGEGDVGEGDVGDDGGVE